MGNKLFGVDIAKIIKDEVGPGVLDATLTVFAPGTRLTATPTAGTHPTSTPYACKGFIDSQAQRDFEGTLAADGEKVIVLIGDTISSGTVAPSANDQITIEGTIYTILSIDRDPAAATYTCGVRAN